MRCQTLSQYTFQSLGRSGDHGFKFLWKLSQRSRASISPRTTNLENQNLLGKTRDNGWIYIVTQNSSVPRAAAQSKGDNQYCSAFRALPTTLFCFIISTSLKNKSISEIFKNKFHILQPQPRHLQLCNFMNSIQLSIKCSL